MSGVDAASESLPQPTTSAGRQGLAALLAEPSRALVALDFDGTLSPIVSDPDTSRLAPGGLAALQRLSAVVGQVAVLTGRPAEVVVRLGGLDAVPGLIVEGQYGQEKWRDGTLHVPEAPPGIAEVRAALPGLVAEVTGAPVSTGGAWIEDKGLAVVVHTRRAPDPDGALAALTGPVEALAAAHGLHVAPGRYVLEVRKSGEDKGRTLHRLVEEFDPGVVLFAGDDVGDLPAFETVERLRAEGRPGLRVCSGSTEAPAVAGHADLVVDGPPAVVELLAALATAVTASGPA